MACSLNGTFVDGKAVTGTVTAMVGSVISIGTSHVSPETLDVVDWSVIVSWPRENNSPALNLAWRLSPSTTHPAGSSCSVSRSTLDVTCVVIVFTVSLNTLAWQGVKLHVSRQTLNITCVVIVLPLNTLVWQGVKLHLRRCNVLQETRQSVS